MTQLKEILNAALVRELAAEISQVHPPFDAAGFIARGLDGLDQLELAARADHLAGVMLEFLPRPFPKAAKVLNASLGPKVAPTGENGLSVLRYMPHVAFVRKYGLDDFESAMSLQLALTKRFSAEWSIRAFLVKYPEKTYARLLEWARDPDAHVRRLVSEGTRPRLPWATRLRAFQEDPRPVIALLELLKDDPSRYVQRSVANNINDIAKDHPDLAVELCRRWLDGATPGREWIVKHALRSLVKKGHPGALSLSGAGDAPSVRIEEIQLRPARVGIGGKLRFSLSVVSTAKTEQSLLIDYAVHFVKANGATRPKVFKLRKIALPPKSRMELAATVSFEDMTTRRHYPGPHRIELLINGVPFPLAAFDVVLN